MPAAAVTPTLKVYVKVVAVKTLVVGFRAGRSRRKPPDWSSGGVLASLPPPERGPGKRRVPARLLL